VGCTCYLMCISESSWLFEHVHDYCVESSMYICDMCRCGAHVVAGTDASAGRKGARMMRSDVPCVFAFRVHLQCVADSFFADLEIRVRFGLSMGSLHHGMAGMDMKSDLWSGKSRHKNGT
jgi:hypothetical protein